MPTLSDVCELIVDSEHKTAPKAESGHPMIRTPDIGVGRLNLDRVQFVDEPSYLEWTRRATPQPNDLILAREAPVGNVGIVLFGMEPCLGQRTVLLRPNREAIVPLFLNYLLSGSEFRARMDALSNGATVPHLNMKDIRGLELPELPPQNVQYRIASVLSAYDELIENNTRRIQILEEMAQAIYREWFVEFRYPGHNDVPLVDSELGPIPKGWGVREFGDTVTMGRKNVDPRTRPAEIFAHFSLPAFDRNHQPVFEAGVEIMSIKREIPGPCVLYSKLNPRIPRVWFVDGRDQGGYCPIASSEFLVLMPQDNWTLSLIFAVCCSPEFANRVVGMAGGTSTSHQRARPGDLFQLPVVDPPPELVERLDVTVRPMLDLAEALRSAVRNLRATRDLLLPRLISGEIDVSELAIDTSELAA